LIGKTGSGAGFGGLTRYLLTGKKDEANPERVLWTSTRELALDEPRHAAAVMRATAAQGQTEKPVQHLSISLPPGEHLSREQWEGVVDITLRDLGLSGHQALVVAHRDKAHEHIHIMVNRVHPETQLAWDRWQDRPRLMASLRPQEIALGLQPTPHVKDPDRVPDPLVQRFERTGELPLLDYARAAGRSVFLEARSWNELHENLAERGLYLERKGQGLVVTDDHAHVKASSVDRAASLRALEGRFGPYEERVPVLLEVDQTLRAGQRRRELAEEMAPLYRVRQETSLAATARDSAARRLDSARTFVRSAIEGAFRDPNEAARRYLAHLDAGSPPAVQPAGIGRLQGSVVHAGRNYLPLGTEGERAYRVAAESLPEAGSLYQRAQEELAQAERQLAPLRQRLEQLEHQYRPQVSELEKLGASPQRIDPEDVMSLRPRDQIALARVHGSETLIRSAEAAPEAAGRTVAAREWWLRNLTPDLDRALTRQLGRRRIDSPRPGQSPDEWMANAVRRGLQPKHGAQALARAGVSLLDNVRATSRALSMAQSAIRNPVKTAAKIAASALGVPAVAVRLAVAAVSLAQSIGRALTR
jgi:hypothetical protein